ncbi:MAG: SMC family ATPase [Anaerolineales bacterium]|nr:SMC family ATPase [Anaerolineales bacterium]
MIPIGLKLSGFLSYRDPVEVDFTTFHLACISGHNGAGKSSLLDAITWALFGQARKRDESVINLQSKTAEVIFTFDYEGNRYRVLRALTRGKPTLLEFQIRQSDGWRPLTERSVRETQTRIEQTLRLDYETFVNASFFLQGKADQFAQQPPSKRKEILASILGLEMWEVYRERAADRRKALERQLELLSGRLAEIDAELATESERRKRLSTLEADLQRLVEERRAHEQTLERARRLHAALEKQRELVQTISRVLEQEETARASLQARREERRRSLERFADLLARAEAIEADYAAWRLARGELERWEELALRFQQLERRRQPWLDTLNAERARLQEEQRALQKRQSEIETQTAAGQEWADQLEQLRQALADLETRLQERLVWQAEWQNAQQQRAALEAENLRLREEMHELDSRRKQLEQVAEAACPLCGQVLTQEHRRSTLNRLIAEGTARGERYRANREILKNLETHIADLERRLTETASLEHHRVNLARQVAQWNERLAALAQARQEWETIGAPRLAEVSRLLSEETFAPEARRHLSEVEAELASLGYDSAAHQAARQRELALRHAEEEMRQLETARAALRPLEEEIAGLEASLAEQEAKLARQRQEYDQAAAALAAAETAAPSLHEAERLLYQAQERENQLNQEVGAARQKVLVLDELRRRKQTLLVEREELARQIGRYKTLERAFGKDGVPALLIEQALPEIEARANQLLDRLSAGTMSVRFVTQAVYKDKKREDLKETLDIQISDGAGIRDYEMYSGGEAFRVNFAIRLALSQVLAARKGARLQMLVIDEGFGSQDVQGRQRLLEAIRLVQNDFAKILVITHLEDLKDAFPTRIEVEKGERGSAVRVM